MARRKSVDGDLAPGPVGRLCQSRDGRGPPGMYTTTAWTSMTKSATEVTADQAACDAQLPQETHGGAASLYVTEPFWVAEVRRCMQRTGWTPPHWKFFSF